MKDVLSAVSARRGHFVLESGYHTDLWLTLDALFVDPQTVAPLIETLAGQLRPYQLSGICGPLLGGAFLAQALATTMGLRFYCAEPRVSPSNAGLFAAEYQLPPGLRQLVEGEQVAVVDEVISAGSSVRATMQALDLAGATTLVIGTFLTLGSVATEHFAGIGVPLIALEHRDFPLWKPTECPLCRTGTLLEDTPR